MVLPLKLAPMEQYMLADDRPSHPMVLYWRLRFEGQFDRGSFERAVLTATARHPLLTAVLQSKGNTARWVAADERRPQIDWIEDLDHDVLNAAEPIDLHSEAGLRLWVCEAEGRTDLWLGVHHACCDGLGALRFAEDLLAAYAAARHGREAKFPPLRAEQLRDRGVFTNSRFTQWLRWPIEALLIAGSVEYFVHRPVPLALPDEETADADESLPRHVAPRHRFTLQQTEALLGAAREQDATLNDLLLRDVFLASQDWIDRHRAQEKLGHVRVAVPVSLRTRLHAEMPAANCVCMINVERRVHRWPDLDKMLRWVNWEMGLIKRWRLGVVMLRIVQLLRLVTGNLKLLLPKGRCVASCVLSNLGRPFHDSPLADANGCIEAGDVRLVDLDVLPPIRPLTTAAFGVASHAGRLTISLRADARALGPEGAEELLALYVERLSQTAGIG